MNSNSITVLMVNGKFQFVSEYIGYWFQCDYRQLEGCSVQQLLFHSGVPVHIRKQVLQVYRDFCIHKRNHSIMVPTLAGTYLLIRQRVVDQEQGVYLFEFQEQAQPFVRTDAEDLATIMATVAHEIRNPLTSIRGFAQLMKPYLSELNKENYANVIISEIDRANTILYELLDQSSVQQQVIEVMDMNLILEHIQLVCEADAKLRGIEFKVKSMSQYSQIYGNECQMKQVLLNLIQNAFDALNEDDNSVPVMSRKKVSVTMVDVNDQCLIVIEDNGPGIDASAHSRMFEPFYTTKKHGTGLGLSISKKLIEQHGGAIHLQSSRGKGTTFTIALPLLVEVNKIG